MNQATTQTLKTELSDDDIDRVIEMAWEDRTPFEAIEAQFALAEQDVIRLMRQQLKPGSFRNWRARVSGRSTKHQSRRPAGVDRGYCSTQYKAPQYRQSRRKSG